MPKRRWKAILGPARRQLRQIFHGLAPQKECQILEWHLMPDHVHMCIAIPPKPAVASGEHFWVHGYAVSTVGFELEQVRQYIREQGIADGNSGQF